MNSFRIINGVFVLREKFGFIFNLSDLVGVYMFLKIAHPNVDSCPFAVPLRSPGFT